MTQDDLNEIRDLLSDQSDKWRLDVGDWMGYVEELIEHIDSIEQQKAELLEALEMLEAVDFGANGSVERGALLARIAMSKK
jgi:hypothetical protein